MKVWYRAVCDKHGEAIHIFVTNFNVTCCYFNRDAENIEIQAWLSKHSNCDLRFIHSDADLDYLCVEGYPCIAEPGSKLGLLKRNKIVTGGSMNLLEKLEELKQRGNYALQISFGEGVGCDDSDVPMLDRALVVMMTPVGYLGSFRAMWKGKVSEFLEFDVSSKPVIISNPPTEKEYNTTGYYAWGTEQSIEQFNERWSTGEDSLNDDIDQHTEPGIAPEETEPEDCPASDPIADAVERTAEGIINPEKAIIDKVDEADDTKDCSDCSVCGQPTSKGEGKDNAINGGQGTDGTP